MARIENHKYSIEEAFRECFYIVPDYQREYVWTDKEVHQLLEDIGEQIDAGTTREYFIGTVLVSPTDQKNHYEVIDGQQRLTTFFLLLCALKHLFQGEPQRQMISGLISTSYVDGDGEVRTNLKLEPRYESAGEVMAKLVELDAEPMAVRAGIQAAGIASFGSLENLVSAYSTLYRYLKDTSLPTRSALCASAVHALCGFSAPLGRSPGACTHPRPVARWVASAMRR